MRCSSPWNFTFCVLVEVPGFSSRGTQWRVSPLPVPLPLLLQPAPGALHVWCLPDRLGVPAAVHFRPWRGDFSFRSTSFHVFSVTANRCWCGEFLAVHKFYREHIPFFFFWPSPGRAARVLRHVGPYSEAWPRDPVQSSVREPSPPLKRCTCLDHLPSPSRMHFVSHFIDTNRTHVVGAEFCSQGLWGWGVGSLCPPQRIGPVIAFVCLDPSEIRYHDLLLPQWKRICLPVTGPGRPPRGGHGNELKYACLKIPWTEEPGALQSMGSQRVRHDWATEQQQLSAYFQISRNKHFWSNREAHLLWDHWNMVDTTLQSLYGHSPVQFSRSVVSNSLQPHEPQHARPPCPSPTPGVHLNPCPLSWWCHRTISSSVVPFSSRPQSFPASGSFQMSRLFPWGGQSIGVSASTSVLPMNTQDWFPLVWTAWISLQSKGLSRVFSNTTVQKHQFFSTQLSL